MLLFFVSKPLGLCSLQAAAKALQSGIKAKPKKAAKKKREDDGDDGKTAKQVS